MQPKMYKQRAQATRKEVCSEKKLGDLLSSGKDALAELGPFEAEQSAAYLLQEVLGIERLQLHLNVEKKISALDEKIFWEKIDRRAKRIPLAHILGKSFFWNEELQVSRACLIPRPETEILVEKVIENLSFEQNEPFSFLDLATGSGAIGIALLRNYLRAVATLSDISNEALRIARVNLEKYRLTKQARLVVSNLFENLEEGRWNLIVSNPPYLSHQDLENLQPEVCHDPTIALDGGIDGYDFYRQIARQAPHHLMPLGILALEIGCGQASYVSELLRAEGFKNILIYPDYAGIDRVMIAKLS